VLARVLFFWSEKENATSGEFGGELHLGTRVNGGGISSDLIIDSAGNATFAGTITSGPTFINGNTDNSVEFLTIDDADPTAGSQRPHIKFTGAGSQLGKIRVLDNGVGMQFLNSSDDEKLVIRDTGNVGIGTTSPQRNLTVYESSGNAVLQLANSTSGVGASDGFLAYTDGVNVGLENKENGYLSLATNASEKMRITSTGNVGIGTTLPGTLHNASYGTTRLHIDDRRWYR